MAVSLKDALKLSSIPVVLASLCCLAPLVLVLLGISTTAFAASLSDQLYYGYAWAFRIVGLLALAGSLWYYFYSKGICTLDDAKRNRNKVINIVVLTLLIAVAGYFLFLYVIVDYVGILVGIWD